MPSKGYGAQVDPGTKITLSASGADKIYYRILQKRTGNAGIMGDDYPAKYKNAAQDGVIDEWQFYNREAVSFAAWRLNLRNGVAFGNNYAGTRWGNAKDWGSAALRAGIRVDDTLGVGSIWWSSAGTYGHVAWVAAVNGSYVTIEEYNYTGNGTYNTRIVQVSSATGYIHIKDIASAALPDDEQWSVYDQASGIVVPEGLGSFSIEAYATKTGCLDSDIINCIYAVKQQAAPPTEEEAKDAAKDMDLAALTNVQPKLSDVPLPDGWVWANPQQELKPFAGDWKKSFAVQYYKNNDRNTKPCATSLPVSVATVTGVKINAKDCGTLNLQDDGKKTGTLLMEWVMSNASFDMSQYADKVQSTWSSSDSKVASVSEVGTVTARKAGSATITLNVEIANPADANKPYKYKATYGVKVVDGAVAAVDLLDDDITGFTLQNGIYYGAVSGDAKKPATAALTAYATNATSLSVKSSDTSVIEIGKIKNTASTQEKTCSSNIQLTVKAAGSAKITLTANDTAKTAKTITLYVTDPNPSISSDIVTVNLMQTDGTVFYLYPHGGYDSLQVDGAVYSSGGASAPFTVEKVKATKGGWAIKPETGVLKNTVHKLSIKGKATKTDGLEDTDSFTIPLTVKIVEKKPAYTVKQAGKVNLFYKNGSAALRINSNEKIESVTLEKCKFTVKGEAGDYSLEAVDGQDNSAWLTSDGKKGMLTITFKGYGPVSQTFAVATQDRVPDLTLNSKTAKFYANARTAATYVMEGRKKADLAGVAFTCYRKGNLTAPDALFTVDALGSTDSEAGGLLIEIPKSAAFPEKSVKADLVLSLKHDNWNRAVTLAYTADMRVENPALKLSSTVLRLNANAAFYENAEAKTVLGWKDGAKFDVAENKIEFKDNKDAKAAALLENQDVEFAYDAQTKEITASLKSAGITKGTYKYKAVVELEDDKTAEATFQLTVVNEALALKLSQTKLRLNTTFYAYDAATTVLSWKNEGTPVFLEDEVDVVDDNSAAIAKKLDGGVEFEYDALTRNITFRLKDGKVPKGTYKFKVQVPVEGDVTVETPVTVQVVDDAYDKSVRLAQRGTIDILNREGTFVIVTPSVKAINGKVVDAELTGDYAHVFDAEFDRDGGRVMITADRYATLITQYDYKVKLILAIVNGDDQLDYTTADIKLRLKQGRPRVALSPVGAVFFSGIETSAVLDVAAALSGAKTPPAIETMELLNYTEAFMGEYKEVNGQAAEKLVLTSKTGAVKGKTYRLQFKVTLEGQADNERATTVTYAVKVK